MKIPKNIKKWARKYYVKWGFYPMAGGKSSSKAGKAEQTAAQQRQEAEQKAGTETQVAANEAERRLMEAGKTARSQMMTAGEPSAEETSRLNRYRSKALTPAETLMTESGPISQAVARRIQERVETPGLDFQRDLPAYVEGIHQPLWRSLKARGIAPPPGSEGGGLGTQQYMKGAEPALAELRGRAISEDIGRGQAYGTEARELQDFWTQLEGILGEAIQERRYKAGIGGAEAEQLGVREGAQYGVKGAEAKGAGFTEAARINQEEVNTRYARKREEATQLGRDIGTALMLAAAPFTGGATLAGIPAVQGMGGGGGGAASAGTSLASALLTRRAPTQFAEVGGMGRVPIAETKETPYGRMLAKRSIGRG